MQPEHNCNDCVAEDNMRRITFKGGVLRMARTSKVTERLEKKQERFIVILLIMTILMVMIVGVSRFAALLALLTGTWGCRRTVTSIMPTGQMSKSLLLQFACRYR